ncbi:hypothetical protein ACLB2K_060630 [Fragaria x ananassa]
MNNRRGTRARVRILRKLSAPIKEAFREMPFEFRLRRFQVKLNVKYDRTVGFCKVCGLLVHSELGCAGPSKLPKLSFSIPGISATDLALKLDRLRTPPVLQLAPIAAPTLIVETPQVSTPTSINSVKRGPDLALVPLGKRAKKRKSGRPKGSLNKKPTVVADQSVQGPKRAKKRSFGAQKYLKKELDKA